MSVKNEKWVKWAAENLASNCDPIMMYQTLRINGFSDPEIKAMLKEHYPAGAANGVIFEAAKPIEVPKEGVIDYKALSLPKITRATPEQGVFAIDDDRIQAYCIKKFLTDAECDSVMNEINKNLRPSTVTTARGGNGVKDDVFRTSRTCELNTAKSKIAAKVDKKIASALGISVKWSEPIQGQKYQVGQEFKAHTDYFEPRTQEYAQFAAQRGQRTWTFMIYLNSTLAGGETTFPNVDLSFTPTKGMAVVWNNLLPDGTPNPYTIHHATPVKDGHKIVITKWFRNKGVGNPFL